MNMKTAELSGAALDWAVAKCEGFLDNPESWMYQAKTTDLKRSTFHPSIHWAQGGPIIEREFISVSNEFSNFIKGYEWAAWTPAPIRDDAETFGYGPTPLVAAMRCYVASKLGDTVDIPADLLTN